MITKNNADLYRKLFEQANTRLETFGVREGPEEDSPYVTIESIEEYFAHIKDIILEQAHNPNIEIKCPVCGEILITRIAKLYDLEDNLMLHPKARCPKCPFQIK